MRLVIVADVGQWHQPRYKQLPAGLGATAKMATAYMMRSLPLPLTRCLKRP